MRYAMAAIAVKGLSKRYGDHRAVDDVSFAVEPGEVFALLGPNGAGKTTTLEICEGFRSRDGGRVDVLGFDPARRLTARAMRERIGIVLQECAVEPYLTVREVLVRNAGYYPRPRGVDEVIELVGLTEKAGERVKKLSGGQQRRLDVGLGIVGDPELLFLDEPTTGFDPSARRGSWEMVRKLTGGGATVILTTHYMDEAQALADRVAVIAGGRIVAIGDPDELGGRDAEAARISFRLPAGASVADLPVPARLDEGLAVVRTNEETRVLHALTGWALDAGVTLDGLSVARPTLEDVYLRLTSATPQAATENEGVPA
jgi:ABC-2 type transport system ATP-binding protein